MATAPVARQRTLREGVTHPATLTMIAGNAVILTIAVVQLVT